MSPRASTLPPEIPGLRFIESLGVGGFAEVYRYEQLGRTVAVKVLTQDLSYNSQQSFEAEANQMARLSNHPSIVSIYHAGVAPDGRSYLVMEVCHPYTLEQRIKSRTFPVAKALEITIQVAGAVESAHRLGVLHRDIKPANILFTEFGRAALTDFGISVSTQAGEQGVGIGVSPAWAPPEQVTAGQPMVPASDVYSLAATCWAMLGGRSPMVIQGGDNSNLALMARARTEPVPPLRREDVPESLERVLRTAMAKQVDQRYASALEFGRALQTVQTSLHVPVTPIEVGDESQDEGGWEEETSSAEVGSTRISSFKVIDPEAAPAPAVTPAPKPGAPIVPSTGPRDFTGPSIPLPLQDSTVIGAFTPQPSLTEPPPGEEVPQRRSRLAPVVGAAVLVALAGSIVVWQTAGGGESRGTTQDTAVDEVDVPVDAVGQTVPSVERVSLKLKGGRVTVTWLNPDPQPGDSFIYRVADPTDERPYVGPVESGPVSLPAEPSRTCVEVVLRRSNGQTSDGTTECTE